MRVLLVLFFFFCVFIANGQGFKYTDISDVPKIKAPNRELLELLEKKELRYKSNLTHLRSLKKWATEIISEVEDPNWRSEFEFTLEVLEAMDGDFMFNCGNCDEFLSAAEIRLTVDLNDYNAWVLEKNIRIREEALERAALELKKEQERLKAESDRQNLANGKSGVYLRLTQKTSLRAYPDSQSRVILRFDPEDKVLLIEEFNEWWTRVEFNGKVGYVKKKLLK